MRTQLCVVSVVVCLAAGEHPATAQEVVLGNRPAAVGLLELFGGEPTDTWVKVAPGPIDHLTAVAINTALSFAATVAWHELGHVLAASFSGCRTTDVRGPRGTTLVSVHWRCRRRDSAGLQSMRSLAGIGMTAAGSQSLEAALRRNALPPAARPLAATMALLMLLDGHRYLWSAALKHFAGLPISDANDVHNVMLRHLGSARAINAAYGLALAVSALELLRRRETLQYLLATALGHLADSRGGAGVGLDAGLYLTGEGFFVGLRGGW